MFYNILQFIYTDIYNVYKTNLDFRI